MRVAFHTLGCKVNHYETEAIREAFVSRGAISAGEDECADVYIINTCTVTNIADRKSRQYIRRMKKVNPDALIVVTGCYAQVEPEEVALMPEVDMVIGNGRKSEICGLVMQRMQAHLSESISGLMTDSSNTQPSGRITYDRAKQPSDLTLRQMPAKQKAQDAGVRGENACEPSAAAAEIHVLPRSELTEYEDMGLVTSSEPGMTRAYIKIQEGCDRFCSYCLIPYARGPVRSRQPGEILEEAEMLLRSGVREIVLTGINTALYGTEPDFSCALTDEDGRILPGLEEIAAEVSQSSSGVQGCGQAHVEAEAHSMTLAADKARQSGRPPYHDSSGRITVTSAGLRKAGIAPLEIILSLLDALEIREEPADAGSTDAGRVLSHTSADGNTCGCAQETALAVDFRVRLSSLEPTVVDRHNVERIIRFRRLCHHLHLSVQAGSDHVLRAMNRHYSREDYLEIVSAIREYDPLYGITTDIIVGFPGETGADFDDTLDLVSKAGFGKVHVFRYSPRKGTAGASLADHVPGTDKIRRAEALENAAARTALGFIEANIGTVQTVLPEEEQDGYLTGYTGNYIRVYIDSRLDNRWVNQGGITGNSLAAGITAPDTLAAAGRESVLGQPEVGVFCRVKLTEPFRDGCKAELIGTVQ